MHCVDNNESIEKMIYNAFKVKIEIIETNMQFATSLNWVATVKLKVSDIERYTFGIGDTKIIAITRAIILALNIK